jgi:hypothetical protein
VPRRCKSISAVLTRSLTKGGAHLKVSSPNRFSLATIVDTDVAVSRKVVAFAARYRPNTYADPDATPLTVFVEAPTRARAPESDTESPKVSYESPSEAMNLFR